MIKILIADDHQIVLDGLISIIEEYDDFELVADVVNGKQALEYVQNVDIDVVLLDIDMPVMNGIEATKLIKKEKPNTKILVLSMHHEKNLIKNLIRCGVDGYILKNSNKYELINAIITVYGGQQYLGDDVKALLANENEFKASKFDPNDGFCDLTTREIEILKLIAEGLSNKQIGDKVFISHRTVDTHRTNIMRKIDVKNIAGLIRFAIQRGIVG